MNTTGSDTIATLLCWIDIELVAFLVLSYFGDWNALQHVSKDLAFKLFCMAGVPTWRDNWLGVHNKEMSV